MTEEHTGESSRDTLDEVRPFMGINDAHEDLADASDDVVLERLFANASETSRPEDSGSLSEYAMSVFVLRERGYVVEGEPGELVVRDPEGNELDPAD